MKTAKYLFAVMMTALILAGCSDDKISTTAEGYVTFNTTISADVKRASSRATQDELRAELSDSFIFWLTRKGNDDKAGVIRTYKGLDNIPSLLQLSAGSYMAEAWAGDSVPASFTSRWFKGVADFDVTAGEGTAVNIDCKIANVVVSFEYDNATDILQKFDINSVVVSHARGQLDFTSREHERGYFMMPSTDKDLAWQFNVTRKADNTDVQYSGKLQAVKPGYEYHFVISLDEQPNTSGSNGGAFLEISVNEEEIPAFGSVTIDAAPTIKGVGFDIDETQVGSSSLDPLSVYLTATSAMSSVILSCDDFPTLLGISGTSFDVFGAQTSVIENIRQHGVEWLYGTQVADGMTLADLKIYFKDAFVQSLQSEKTYNITITAKDQNGLVSTRTLSLLVTSAPVSVTQPTSTGDGDVNAGTNSYTVTGELLDGYDAANDIIVYYKPEESRSRADWSSVKATISGNTFSAYITGLVSGASYRYYVETGSYISPEYTFATICPQLPNCGFEDWQTSSSPYLIYPAGGSMFWDSGNHGSATMKKNVTVPDGDIKHSGNFSIKLASQFVGVGSLGKFAAGNVFIGQYLGTEGTDGILGFGRPFKYRPTKIRGYVRYVPAEVKYTNDGAPDIVKGEPDKGIIYAALLDGTCPDAQYPGFPVIIKTKTHQLFNKDGANVIGYGEKVFTEATSGDGMVMFEIPIDYRNGATPCFIMLTASASKGGDYFAGGASTMWLDDIELVYE